MCGQRGDYFCPKCLATLARAHNHGDTITALNYHDERVKKAIWLLKYGGVSSLAEIFGTLIYQALIASEHITSDGTWLLLPAPLSSRRRHQRGFNQAEEIAKAIAKQAPDTFTVTAHLVTKVKNTPSQVSIKNRAARLANLKDAFVITSPEKISGCNVIVVDDVITTGATTGEIKKVAQQAGAQKIVVAAVAHG